jgi:hypothetical protein
VALSRGWLVLCTWVKLDARMNQDGNKTGALLSVTMNPMLFYCCMNLRFKIQYNSKISSKNFENVFLLLKTH